VEHDASKSRHGRREQAPCGRDASAESQAFMRQSIRRRVLITSCVMLAISGGCRRHLGADIAGTVTIDGKPAPAGKVVLYPCEGGAIAAGVIQPDGRYRIQTGSTMSLKPGAYRVAVAVYEGDASTGGTGGLRWLAAERFASPDTSGLEHRIEYGSNTVDFDLPAVP